MSQPVQDSATIAALSEAMVTPWQLPPIPPASETFPAAHALPGAPTDEPDFTVVWQLTPLGR